MRTWRGESVSRRRSVTISSSRNEICVRSASASLFAEAEPLADAVFAAFSDGTPSASFSEAPLGSPCPERERSDREPVTAPPPPVGLEASHYRRQPSRVHDRPSIGRVSQAGHLVVTRRRRGIVLGTGLRERRPERAGVIVRTARIRGAVGRARLRRWLP